MNRLRTLVPATAAACLALALPTLAHAASEKGFNYAGPFDGLDTVTTVAHGGPGFNGALFDEYKKLALFEAENQYDFIDGEIFAGKAKLALRGTTPQAADPTTYDIDSASDLQDLQAGRTELIGALAMNAGQAYPQLAAKAQVTYDCWVEQTEEGHQAWHIKSCEQDFSEAMKALHEAMGERAILAESTIYFDFDRADIRDDGQMALDDLVANLDNKDDVVMNVTGHADRSGSADYNQALSERRAEAVRNELARQGLRIGEVRIDLDAEGESQPAVATADGVREPLNRRVQVDAVAADHMAASPVSQQQAMATRLW